MSDERPDSAELLEQARQTIAEKDREIAALRGQLQDQQFVAEFRDAFTLATIAGTIAAPVDTASVVRNILRTAAYVIPSQAASLFLVHGQGQELVAVAALGPKSEEVERLRLPLGRGIVGLVAASGQPMAITDAQGDPRHASEVARALGYAPRSILCVPLIYNDQVLGVLELLDRLDGTPFTATDMEALGLFADQAAFAIEQSRTLQGLAGLIGEVLGLLQDSPERERLLGGARDFARRLEESPTYRQALDLARQVQDISRFGEDELRVCKNILGDFADYLRARVGFGSDLWQAP